MREAKNVFIGFGKAAKTLAFKLAKAGESVIMIEGSDQMYGGTCINIACIPSKLLYTLSMEPVVGTKQRNYHQAILNKRGLIGSLRTKNLHKIADLPAVAVLTGWAKFTDDHTLMVSYANGTSEQVRGERIFINTGAKAITPTIPGLSDSKFMVTSTEMLDQAHLPKQLVIIGGGYIGLEFATTYAQFGAQVTVLDKQKQFMSRDEREVAQAVHAQFDQAGIQVVQDVAVTQVTDAGPHAVINASVAGKPATFTADMILVATGRAANIKNLGLENTTIKTTARGIAVDDHLRTSAENVWAMGDVRGGAQFTYISLDDYRIVYDQLLGEGKRSLQEQEVVPHTVFLNPPLSTIGLNEEQVKAQGINYRVAKIPAAAMPKAHILGNSAGYLKALVGAENQILGATLFCVEAYEVINLISLAMHQHLPYQVLRDQIFAHPTMSEALNDLFETLA
ncbi:FAD-dependent oxidoreductase [Loigolactobacillus zhaoyuanensis]|uniref:FAD-dependent oxidoreductase n=1 Tax=Loigolactobacillus zhaoyuanensis TaxID=2486017 RepID=A0ABW8UFQ2_9LACO|nr:FAD-dependent oxidoreductase [Loigolactobacillus zhaoyuanensis]